MPPAWVTTPRPRDEAWDAHLLHGAQRTRESWPVAQGWGNWREYERLRGPRERLVVPGDIPVPGSRHS